MKKLSMAFPIAILTLLLTLNSELLTPNSYAGSSYDSTRLIVLFGERAVVCSTGGSPYSGIAVIKDNTVEQTILLPHASPENIMLNKPNAIGNFVYISCANVPQDAPYHSYIYRYNNGRLQEPPAEKLAESCLGCHSAYQAMKNLDQKTLRVSVPEDAETIAKLIGDALGSGPPNIMDTQRPRP